MIESAKKISVIMGIYNCAGTLSEAIESIIAQTYDNWELVMCDDASTDETYAIAQAYKDRYPDKIILIRNEQNSRLAYSLNHCLEYATGEYVARMDGDDRCLPERFAIQVDYLQKNPECDLVGTAMQRFSEEGMANIDAKPEHPDKFSLRTYIPFHHATIMTYKRVYNELNGYTVAERTMRAQDYDLWFRFFAAGFKGDNIQDALYLVREDAAAIRRRTFSVRWNAFKTTRIGYQLLGYPKHWIVRPFVETIVKSITPYRAIELYRKWQKNHSDKQ